MEKELEMMLSELKKGDRRSASRVMSLIENQGPGNEEALRGLYAMEKKALVIGITGWPGVGKSTLISRIAKFFLQEGKKVGIIAVDPTSPFSGGGLLGDRIRFREIEGHEGLFIRSVASRGHHGGLSRSARGFVKVMEAMGSEIVLLETVGVGQDQITVSLIADTTVVVVAPGLGDHLQAIKSGILEIGDIFIVNKADRSDADRAVYDLEAAIRMRGDEGWCPSVVKTVAADGTGMEEVMKELTAHAVYCAGEKGVMARKVRAAKAEIRDAVKTRLLERFTGARGLDDERMAEYARDVCGRKIDPYLVADLILAEKGEK